MLLTAAQCLFGVAVLSDLKLSLWQSAILGGLFLLQPLLSDAHYYVAAGYLVLFAGILVLDRHSRQGVWSSVRVFLDLLRNRPREPETHG